MKRKTENYNNEKIIWFINGQNNKALTSDLLKDSQNSYTLNNRINIRYKKYIIQRDSVGLDPHSYYSILKLY